MIMYVLLSILMVFPVVLLFELYRFWKLIPGFILFLYLLCLGIDIYYHKTEVSEEEYVSFTQDGVDGVVVGSYFCNLNKEFSKDIEEGSIIIYQITEIIYPIAPDDTSTKLILKNDKKTQ